RDYADGLGMDANAMVGLLNDQWSRTTLTDPEPAPIMRPPLAAASARPLGLVSVGLALVLLLVSAAVFLTRASDHPRRAAQPPPASQASSSTPANPPPSTSTPPPPPPTAPVVARLTVTAATGAC